MSYEFHITRAEDYSDSEKDPITWEDWDSFARSHPHLASSDVLPVAGTASGGVYSWLGIEGPSLTWWKGQIDVKGLVNEDLIASLVDLAAELDATLQGDDGERY